MNDQATADEKGSDTAGQGPIDDANPNWINRWLHEPLGHFLLLGAALFAVYTYVNHDRSSGQEQIVVSAGKIEQLAAIFTRTWQRPPTRSELDGLVRDYVREEAAYREGLALGLDQNDTIIRRRLRQKLDFVAEDLVRVVEPSEEELAAYLQEHQEAFRIDPELSFRQIYFNPEAHGEDIREMISDTIATLRDDSSIEPQEQGDRTLLEHQYVNVSLREVRALFGDEFAATVVDLEPLKWQGPVRSGYGFHAVFLDRKSGGRLPQLDEVREVVQREWTNQRRQELTEDYYEQLLKQFEVVVQWPDLDLPEGAR